MAGCLWVWVHECMYALTYVRVSVYMHVGMHVFVCAAIRERACMYVCAYIWCVSMCEWVWGMRKVMM